MVAAAPGHSYTSKERGENSVLKDIDKTSGDGRDVPDDSSEVVWVRWPSGRRKRQLRSKWKKFQYPTKTPDDYSGAIGSPERKNKVRLSFSED